MPHTQLDVPLADPGVLADAGVAAGGAVPTRRRGHVVMLVCNEVTNDSRVQKTAISAAAAGFRVTVVGYSPSGAVVRERLGDAEVLRVPVSFALKKLARAAGSLEAAEQATVDPRLGGWWARRRAARAEIRARRRQTRLARIRARIDVLHRHRVLAKPLTGVLWLQIFALRRLLEADRALVQRGRGRPVAGRTTARIERTAQKAPVPPDWRSEIPVLLDFELAYAPVIAELEPDLLHANDYQTLAMAEHAVTVARAAGRDVKLVYDAHEYVAGIPSLTDDALAARVALEASYIGRADAVITVSPLLADRLQQEHGLPERPALVLNAPPAAPFDPQSPRSVRSAAKVPEDAPLLVYSGGVKPERGVETLIRALTVLPGVHCAVVASSAKNPAVRALVETAEDLGCADRVHVVPYAPHDEVINYIRTADVGVHTILPSGNADVALPNKIFEYLHALLPMVVSDVQTMAEIVARQGWGATFTPGDHEGLARACRDVLERRRDLRRTMTDAGVRHEFSWEHQVEVLVDVYSRLLGDAARHGDEAAQQAPAGGSNGHRALVIGPRDPFGEVATIVRAARRAASELHVDRLLDEGDGGGGAATGAHDRQALTWQLARAREVAGAYTHALAVDGESLLGGLNGGSADADVPFLRAHGVEIGVLLSRHPGKELRRRMAGFDGAVFATDPAVAASVPGTTWLPLPIELDRWTSDRPPLADPTPVVVYGRAGDDAVSAATVSATCRALEDEGLVRFAEVEDLSAEEGRSAVLGADIVVDPLGTGGYTLAAVAGMAAGRLVLGRLPDEVRAQTMDRPPIVRTTADALETTLRSVIGDPPPWQVLSRRGPLYAAAHHDGRATLAILRSFLAKDAGGATA